MLANHELRWRRFLLDNLMLDDKDASELFGCFKAVKNFSPIVVVLVVTSRCFLEAVLMFVQHCESLCWDLCEVVILQHRLHCWFFQTLTCRSVKLAINWMPLGLFIVRFLLLVLRSKFWCLASLVSKLFWSRIREDFERIFHFWWLLWIRI